MTDQPTVVPYREHNCYSAHRTHRAMAKCIWRNAIWIAGTGPYATVSYCRRPDIRGDQTSVQLHATLEAAQKSWATMQPCGGYCQGNHRLVVLVLR